MDIEEENVDTVSDGVHRKNKQLVDFTIVFATNKVFATRGELLIGGC
jgi:hypothetical protein